MLRKSLMIAPAALLALAAAAPAAPISGHVTADNHYGLYTGDQAGAVVNFWGANESGSSGAGGYNWSQAEAYSFESADPIIYIAAWSDDNIAQGLLASLSVNGHPLLSGQSVWEVFSTGQDLDDGAPPPTAAALGAQIAIANVAGWSPVAVGGLNGAAPWGSVAGVSGAARWMWYQGNVAGDVFNPGVNAGEYLIFRTRVVPEPSALALLALGGLALRRR